MARRKLSQSLTRMAVKFVASAQSDEEPRERVRGRKEIPPLAESRIKTLRGRNCHFKRPSNGIGSWPQRYGSHASVKTRENPGKAPRNDERPVE